MNLLSADWSSVLSSDNVIDAWERFKSIFMSVVNNISPINEVRIKQGTEPWINAEILQSINDRDRAFKVFKGDKSEQNFSTFKDLRNKTQTLIYNAKKNFFQSKLETSNKDSKSLWRSLKELGMPSKKGKASSVSIGLNIGGEVCFEKGAVAEKINSFYTTAASKLVEKLPKSVNKFGRQFVQTFYQRKGVTPNSYPFSMVSENKLLKYLNNLSANKATGLDGIPSRFVSDSVSVISCPLTHAINLSIIQGVVPDDLKSARVVPLIKKMTKLRLVIIGRCLYLASFPRCLKG